MVRSILTSLACKYRLVLERLERMSARDVGVVHVIGGGSQSELLCRLTADVLDRPVLAGPVEATALGNVLVQARATGELGSLAELRAVAAASADPVRYEPGNGAAGSAPRADTRNGIRPPGPAFHRFLTVTGAATPARA
jgi:rhamnulokinase